MRLHDKARRWALGTAAATLAAVLMACGGGGGSAGTVVVGATSSYTEGTISGFGSIVVGGVRFDESAAAVSDDSGATRSASALKLGMRVEVEGGAVDATQGTAKAAAVHFGSQLVGPVAAVDAVAGTATVLGQVVDVSSTTVFDDTLAAGLSAVTLGSVIEVHGLVDASSGHIAATRIESAAGATAYKLRGTVAALDTTARTFSIGGASISYAGLTTAAVPTALANGVVVRAVLATAPVAGVWQATALQVPGRKLPEQAAAHVRGSITAFTSATQFSVDGLAVDATNASFPDGQTGLGLGVEVDVVGTLSNGVLVATSVSLEAKHRGDEDRRFVLIGSVTALDTTAQTLVLRGVTVSYGGSSVTWVGGTAADLKVGSKLKVQGTPGAKRNQLQATRITFDN